MSVCGFSPEGKWTHFWWWNHASFIAEIFDRGEQQTGNNGFWRERETGKEKMSFFFSFSFFVLGTSDKVQGESDRRYSLYQTSKDRIFLSVTPAVKIFFFFFFAARNRRLLCSRGWEASRRKLPHFCYKVLAISQRRRFIAILHFLESLHFMNLFYLRDIMKS